LDQQKRDEIHCRTSIIIVPGYQFRMVKGLVTNFHQPQSTLLLLIAALVGDNWKNIYQHALNNQYRFLSYGDSSLLWTNG
jgi:S-adenosylmethionine:tRNA ribosyltransferase-isomerase